MGIEHIKRGPILLVLVICISFGGSYCIKQVIKPAESVNSETGEQPIERLISLAPSITETVYLLGLEERLVGVTTYCLYPPQAQELPKVGGYSTPDFEKIVLLHPDLAVIVPETSKAHLRFDELGIETLIMRSNTAEEILDSIRLLGDRCGVGERSTEIIQDIKKRMAAITERQHKHKPTILITVGRNMGSAGLKSVFAAGQSTWYNELIEMAGGSNACPAGDLDYMDMAGEVLLGVNPDIIIDVVPDLPEDQVGDVLAVWGILPGLKAHSSRQIYIMRGEYSARPGPSFIKVLEDIADIVSAWQQSTR